MALPFVSLLKNSLDDRSLIALYTRREAPETFSVGWIVGVSDECYTLAALDEHGRPDSYQFGFIDDVYKITRGGAYLAAMADLMMDHFEQSPLSWPESSLMTVLNWAMESKTLISVHDRLGIETFALVRQVSSGLVELGAYDATGEFDGDAFVLVADIFRIEVAGPSQRAVASLAGLPAKAPET